MDKKSFLRGFGVGVLFTSLILGISFTIRTSDSYVASKAKELGMVYGEDQDSALKQLRAEASTKPDASPVESPASGAGQDDKATKTPASGKDDKATAAPTKTAAPKVTPEVTKEPEPTVTPKKKQQDNKEQMEQEKKRMEQQIRKEMKSLTIVAGDWSSDVSQKLQSLGIIKDAKGFDKYLNDHGYSSSIKAGTYKVSVNDTYNELARKITGR